MLVVGGYTERMDERTPGTARGISLYDFFERDGRLQFLAFMPAVNPSYVVANAKKSLIYAVREKSADAGAAVTVHSIKRGKAGKVEFRQIAEQALPGDAPCHLALAPQTLLVSSYGSGHLHALALGPDGNLTGARQDILLSDASHPGSHLHCSVFQTDKQRVLAIDLGNDRLCVLDRAADGQLTYRPELDLDFPAGQGPRHIALHPGGKLAVVNAEHVGVVHLLDVSQDQPKLLDTANALPERVLNEAWGSAVRMGHSGKMVYAADRNFNVINLLHLDERVGKLQFRDTLASGGVAPRDIVISPDGNWLLSANTTDNTVGVFQLTARSGVVHYHTFRKIPSPTSLAWL
ncbi:beta-propeller fold lactonase family protein [Neolewinella lacunae]|uniref:Beta-propeller fold lactonase family protein n=1 Tax=Neolewinella lacunae TaxID=1517758 RepID=A0A923TCP5_9BACT|nr:beta-propeller fold lactonase family protein [Neolewinella lacunae]MBC6993957.1 beta-propeller fold lactonase family protein [Neolewinella lacunae]MDN3634962.1 beta-propeller fold lactonase family protein [Neolewinella lacunae]